MTITGADVLRALADGKRVRPTDEGIVGRYITVQSGYSTAYFYEHEFEIVEEPATDAALIAEMRRLFHEEFYGTDVGEMAMRCADMLEQRSLKPQKGT